MIKELNDIFLKVNLHINDFITIDDEDLTILMLSSEEFSNIKVMMKSTMLL